MRTASKQKNISSFFIVLSFTILVLLSGCSNQQLGEGEVSEVDPYEGFNRKMHGFNETVDNYVAEPISDAYTWITPQFVQTGVTNFFDNLKGVNVVINDVLQGKGKQGAEDTGRFLLNSTVGIFGLFDVASEVGLEKHEEDFAQTLAVWGVSAGPYLVLPLLGPTTSRGIPGGIFDAAANPASYVGAPSTLFGALNILNTRANVDGELQFIEEAALDSYVFTRESFLQYRNNLINDGKVEDNIDLFDLDDEFDEDDEEDISSVEPSVSGEGLTPESEDKSVEVTTLKEDADHSSESVKPEAVK